MPKQFAFTSGTEIWVDDPSKEGGKVTYSAPQWTDSGTNDPYLYPKAVPVEFSEATFIAEEGAIPPGTTTAKIRGEGVDGTSFEEDMTIVGNEIRLPTIEGGGTETMKGEKDGDKGLSWNESKGAEGADTTKYYSKYTVEWEVSFDDGGTWQDVCPSDFILYACLTDDAGPGLKYRTIVHLACSNVGAGNNNQGIDNSDGATTVDEAITKTWALLSSNDAPANFKGWNPTTKKWDRTLYYYKRNTTFNNSSALKIKVFNIELSGTAAGLAGAVPVAPEPAGSRKSAVGDLLEQPNSSGQCTTWVGLMFQAVEINGGGANPKKVELLDVLGVPLWFLAKNWSYIDPKPAIPLLITQTDKLRYGMAPLAGNPPNQLGEVISDPGIAGQNEATPGQKYFSFHALLEYTPSGSDPIYYDPSYGKTYAGAADFRAKAVQAVVLNNFNWREIVQNFPRLIGKIRDVDPLDSVKFSPLK